MKESVNIRKTLAAVAALAEMESSVRIDGT